VVVVGTVNCGESVGTVAEYGVKDGWWKVEYCYIVVDVKGSRGLGVKGFGRVVSFI